MRIVNRRARRNLRILEKYEAGVVLTGAEVKSIREGRLNLSESLVRIKNREAFLVNAYIHPYRPVGASGYNPRRDRKLLLNKKEITRLSTRLSPGLTIVPLSCYTKGDLIKIEIALAKGKKRYEKKEIIKRRDLAREVERELRGKE